MTHDRLILQSSFFVATFVLQILLLPSLARCLKPNIIFPAVGETPFCLQIIAEIIFGRSPTG